MPRCEQRIDEFVGREWLHVLGRFSDPDEADRHPDAIGDAEVVVVVGKDAATGP